METVLPETQSEDDIVLDSDGVENTNNDTTLPEEPEEEIKEDDSTSMEEVAETEPTESETEPATTEDKTEEESEIQTDNKDDDVKQENETPNEEEEIEIETPEEIQEEPTEVTVSGNTVAAEVPEVEESISTVADVATGVDISKNQDGSIIATFDSSTGTVTITGNGIIKDYAEKDSTMSWVKLDRSWMNSLGIVYSDIRHVIFNGGITAIGRGLFANCSKLETVSGLTESLVDVRACAFQGCSKLTSFDFLPVHSIQKIGMQAFDYCTNIQSDLPIVWESVIDIDYAAFRDLGKNSSGIKSMSFPSITSWKSLAITNTGSGESDRKSSINTGGFNAFSRCNVKELIFENLEDQFLMMVGQYANTTMSFLGNVNDYIEVLTLPKCKTLKICNGNSQIKGRISFKNLSKLTLADNATIGGTPMTNDYFIGGATATSLTPDSITPKDVKIVKRFWNGYTVDTFDATGISEINLPSYLVGMVYNKLVYSGPGRFDGDIYSGCTEFIWTGGVSPSITTNKIPAACTIYCYEDSPVHAWCVNMGRKYVLLDKEKDSNPSIVQAHLSFNAKEPQDLQYVVDLGSGTLKASNVTAVSVNSEVLTADQFTFNGTTNVVISKDYLSTLRNGSYVVSVTFDTGTTASGCTVTINNSAVGENPNPGPGDGNGGTGEEKPLPPEALTIIDYEFYKDHPDVVYIPVKMNSASNVTQLKIGTDVVPTESYELQDGAICLKQEYLATLDAGKYRVLPTFDDPAKTTVSNIRLIVYNKVADRAAPYLLQTRIVFNGQTLNLKFDAGAGSLKARTVLGMVIDDDVVLPNGDIVPFSGDVSTLKSKAYKSITSKESRVFDIKDDVIVWDGDYVSGLNLSTGDHLVGAIFDNTERTTDLKKVVLVIEDNNTPNTGEDDKPDTEQPDNDKPGTSESEKPGTGQPNTDKPGTEQPNTDKPTGDKPGASESEKPGTSEPDKSNPEKDNNQDRPGTTTPSRVTSGINYPIASNVPVPNIKTPIFGTNPTVGTNTTIPEDEVTPEDSVSSIDSTLSVTEEELSRIAESSQEIQQTLQSITEDGVPLSEGTMSELEQMNYGCVPCNCFSWFKIIALALLIVCGNTVSLAIVLPRVLNKKESN